MSTATDRLSHWLSEGPFTVALSSSFFGFFFHCGAMMALEELGLKPRKITGASAGALIGGGVASGLNAQELKEILFSVSRQDFWDPRPGLGILKGQKFLNLLEKHFVSSFEEAKVSLEVAALDILSMKTIFLNRGSLPRAVAASCAVPGMFHPVKINGRFFYDGGVFNKPALQKEKTDERILSIYLESQGPRGILARRKVLENLSENHKVMHFRDFPRVNFYSLNGRDEAFEEGYRRTRQALAQSAKHVSILG